MAEQQRKTVVQASLDDAVVEIEQALADAKVEVSRATADQVAASREFVKTRDDTTREALARAGLRLDGAKAAVIALEGELAGRKAWAHSARRVQRVKQAAAHVKAAHSHGAAAQASAEAFDGVLDALAEVAASYLEAHGGVLREVHAFGLKAAERFEAPHPDWQRNQVQALTDVADQALGNIINEVLRRLDQAFRPYGNPWTSALQPNAFIGYDRSCAQWQAQAAARLRATLDAACDRFGVEVPK